MNGQERKVLLIERRNIEYLLLEFFQKLFIFFDLDSFALKILHKGFLCNDRVLDW
jgi:hypothetical protein